MAKFSRYDPRNKKKDRNKNNSLSKEIRIREQEHKSKINLMKKYNEDLHLKDADV